MSKQFVGKLVVVPLALTVLTRRLSEGGDGFAEDAIVGDDVETRAGWQLNVRVSSRLGGDVAARAR